jgi:VCBS repeat-containing protein
VFRGPLVLASILSGGRASSATVTITPASTDLKNTYTISVVTGTADASQNQVGGARLLSVTTPAYTQTVNATGQGTIPGTQASGTLQVENHDTSNSLTINAGTVFPNQNPSLMIDMQLDQTVTLPPTGFTEVAAHVVEVGTIGNISACCPPTFQNECDSSISNCGQAHDIFNASAFTGGTDPQTYSVVQQSDIDGAANALEQANTPDAQQMLQGQVQANEQFIGTPQRKPNVTSDHAAGDQATSVTVTVTFTCTGEVYNQDAALSMAAQLLTNQSATDPGPGYALTGDIATTVTNAALSDTSGGTVVLTVNAEGVWVYQFSTTQKQVLAKLMINKKKQDVQALLQKQPGVGKVAIHLVGGDGMLFPTDARQITIVVENVAGVAASR